MTTWVFIFIFLALLTGKCYLPFFRFFFSFLLCNLLSSFCCYLFSTDRRSLFVDLRSHVPEKLLQLNNKTRTVQATNDDEKLKVYLYFSEAVLNSSAEILNSLNSSQGTLVPINGKNRGNHRFGFMVIWIETLHKLGPCYQ